MKRKFLIILVGLAIIGYIIRFVNEYTRYRPTLRIGVSSYTGSEYFHIARKENFFKRCGIHVKLVEFGSLEDIQQAFEWHQIDGMVCTLVDAMVIRQKNNLHNSKVILIPSYPRKNNACHLMVKTNIKKLQDLKGKRIGVEINSYGGYILCKLLKSIGLSLKDITVNPMDPTAASICFTHDHIDGAIVYRPFTKDLPSDTHSIFSSAQWPKEIQLNVLLMGEKAINDYNERLCQFVNYWDELLDFCDRNPERCCQWLGTHHYISKEEASSLLKSVHPLRIDEQLPLFCLNRYILDILSNINTEMLSNNNLQNLSNSDALDSIFDTSFIQQTLNH